MKIGLLTAFYPEMIGGAEASLEVLLDGYRRAGLPHVVFTLGKVDRPTASEVITIPYLRYLPRKVKVGGFPLLDDIVGRKLPPLIRRNQVNLLHVLDFYSVCGGVKAANSAGAPTVFTCQNDIGTPFEAFGARFPLNRWMSARERQVVGAIKQCSMTVAVSNFIAGQLAAAGIARQRITTVYVPGIINQWPNTPPHRRELPLRILAMGRLYYDKGFQVLLRAAGRLLAEGRNFQLAIAGRGPYAPTLVRLAAEAGLGEHCRFLGYVSRDGISSLVDWSDVVVVPTLTPEPFPRAGVEAMSRGKPLIGSRVGGIPELIADGQTGFLVAPDEPEEIAEKLRTLDDRPELMLQMGEQALSDSRKRFDGALIVNQLTDIYRSVADSAARGLPLVGV